MLGRHDPQRRLFETVNIEALVPAGHMLRRLARVIDFGFIRDLVGPFYCKNNGRPSHDPVVILKMLVLGRLYDFSDRRLCDEVAMHAGFRWFCGLGFEDEVPDHSTLTTTRDRWSANELEVWQGALDRVIDECVKAGIVSGRHVSLDGTEIRANAAVKSLERIPEPIPMPRADVAASAATEAVEAAAPAVPPAQPPVEPPKTPTAPARKAGDEKFRGERFSNATHRSKTDPEALLFRKGLSKEAKLAYLGHFLIDTKSRTILGADASPARGSEERVVGAALIDALAKDSRFPDVQSLAADKGYGSGAFIAHVAALEIEPHIPVPGSDAIEPLPTYSRGPATLAHARARAHERRAIEARNLARRLTKTPRGRLSHRLRTRVEHVNAEAKQHHGLARARLRGLRKVRTEVKFTATVQNLKRLANRRGFRRAPGVAAAAAPMTISARSPGASRTSIGVPFRVRALRRAVLARPLRRGRRRGS